MKKTCDEFYTIRDDVDSRLLPLKEMFRDKVVYLNCDSAESEFYKFFYEHFKDFNLKKLICTVYLPTEKYSSAIIETRSYTQIHTLLGNGDFRSDECVDYLDEADIVVTNPPFTLIHEFAELLINHRKDFLIITPLRVIRNQKVFTKTNCGEITFLPFKHKTKAAFRLKDGTIAEVPYVAWMTTLPVKRPVMDLAGDVYSPNAYIHYLNYDGIDIPNTKKIPVDYTGDMGVPLGFLTCYDWKDYELISVGDGYAAAAAGVQRSPRGRTDLCFIKDGKVCCPYARLIVRRRGAEEKCAIPCK